MVRAKQDNPSSERMLAVLSRQRNNLRERQTNKAAKPQERIMMLNDHARALSSGSSDEASIQVDTPAARPRIPLAGEGEGVGNRVAGRARTGDL
jgi:hypothetical protein